MCDPSTIPITCGLDLHVGNLDHVNLEIVSLGCSLEHPVEPGGLAMELARKVDRIAFTPVVLNIVVCRCVDAPVFIW
jgi:hypothetical protein